MTKREAAWRELKTKITDYGADCAGFQTHDGRGTLEATLDAAEAYATEKALEVLDNIDSPAHDVPLHERRACRERTRKELRRRRSKDADAHNNDMPPL